MAITVGQAAPDFTLHENPATRHSLSDYRGKNVVLAFFPGAFTGVCTTEMCTLRDSIGEFQNMNAEVIGITVDPPFAQAAWKAANDVTYTFLSDYNREVVNAYDVALPGLAGMEGYVAAKRAVTIIDGQGVVRYHWVADSPANEPDYAEVKAAVAALG